MSAQIMVYLIQGMKDLSVIAESLRQAAREGYVDTAPVYSKSETEAVANAEGQLDELTSSNIRYVQIDQTIYTMILTIDAYDGAPRWHLSLSQPHPSGVPERAPDDITDPFARAVLRKYTEGPPEGAFKNVRHFFAPFELM